MLQLGVGYLLKFWSFKNSFCCKVDDWGIWLFPMLWWFVGCFLMLIFYKVFHTWSSFRLSKTLYNFDFEEHCQKCIHCKQPSGWFSSTSAMSRSPSGDHQSSKQHNRRKDEQDACSTSSSYDRPQISTTSFSQVRMRTLCCEA